MNRYKRVIQWLRLGVRDRETSRKKRSFDGAYKELDKAYDKAKSDGLKDQELNGFVSDYWFEVNWAEEEYRIHLTRKLTSEATRMFIPTPERDTSKDSHEDENGFWEFGWVLRNQWFLTDKGVDVLRRQIRSEKKERFETVARWVTLLIGLLGAVMGVISLINAIG